MPGNNVVDMSFGRLEKFGSRRRRQIRIAAQEFDNAFDNVVFP